MSVNGLLMLGSSVVGAVGAYSTAKKRHASKGATAAAVTAGIVAGPVGWGISALVLDDKKEEGKGGEHRFDRKV